jgi:hypothetical protein
LRNVAEGEDENHVYREMSVWGSAGAHDSYFKVDDEIIITLFNLPIEASQKGIWTWVVALIFPRAYFRRYRKANFTG